MFTNFVRSCLALAALALDPAPGGSIPTHLLVDEPSDTEITPFCSRCYVKTTQESTQDEPILEIYYEGDNSDLQVDILARILHGSGEFRYQIIEDAHLTDGTSLYIELNPEDDWTTVDCVLVEFIAISV